MEKKKYLVTGGAGFIGSHTTECLLEVDNEVVVFDDLSTGSVENLREVWEQIEFVRGCVTSIESLRDVIGSFNPDYLIHLAGLSSVTESIADPKRNFDLNTRGLFNVLEAVRDSSVGRVVFSSSAAIYGDSWPKPGPISPYGLAKWQAEEIGRMYAKFFDISVVALRYFNVYGSRQKGNSGVIGKYFSSALDGKPLAVRGDGSQTRDFVHVSDVARANVIACNVLTLLNGEGFDIGTGDSVSVRVLAEKINRLVGSEAGIVHQDKIEGELMHSQSDVDLAREHINFKAEIDLDAGLQTVLQCYTQSDNR
ncbi:NAD-dependent epimerase/dehydratase family protein [Patescibacteria group bacterium]|nr:NAD-dependent epimerase/dehydratase family protein [Patescibacteria group bacterium]